MHGLVNRAIQSFVVDCYGTAQWQAVVYHADLGLFEFESMWHYDDTMTRLLLTSVSDVLDRRYEELMEDIGTYLVSHPNVSALRRLMRFSGEDFLDFLHSLDELPERARLAVADLELPHIELCEVRADYYQLRCRGQLPGTGFLLMGLLRAMADDYGALVLIEHTGVQGDIEIVAVSLLEAQFSEGKNFELGARTG